MDFFGAEEFVPGIVPGVWKEVRRRTHPRSFWTPPFAARRKASPVELETPQEVLVEQMLTAARRGYSEALDHLSRREIDDAVDLLRDSFRNALIAANLTQDDLMRQRATQMYRRIGKSLRTFSRVTLGSVDGTDPAGVAWLVPPLREARKTVGLLPGRVGQTPREIREAFKTGVSIQREAARLLTHLRAGEYKYLDFDKQENLFNRLTSLITISMEVQRAAIERTRQLPLTPGRMQSSLKRLFDIGFPVF